MRINPAEKITRAEELAAETKIKTDKITRIVAIVVVFLSTYALFFKILFF